MIKNSQVVAVALLAGALARAPAAATAQDDVPATPVGKSLVPWETRPLGVYNPGLTLGAAQPPIVRQLRQAEPTTSQSMIQALSARGQPVQAAAPVDAVYLDQLVPAAIPPASQLAQPQVQPQPGLPPGARDGVFQKAYATGTWLPAFSDEGDALGVGSLETGLVFGFPMLRRDTPLLVTPQFGVHFLDNAGALDLPTELFDAAVEFRHLRKLGMSPWGIDVAATVGYYSDYEQSDSEALRVTGRGIAAYEASPTTKYVIGAAYLNRAGASVLPIAGVIYQPDPTMRWELVFPRPRVAWQTANSVVGDEEWLYVGGEFGGGVWSITRPSTGELDLINYSDWRLLAGYERKVLGRLSWRLEGGYAFNRELEYDDSATADVSLDDSLFLRGGLTY
jgi:hypothetical protein